MKVIDIIIVSVIKNRIKSYIRKVKKMAEKEQKPWYLSKTIIMTAAGFVILLGSLFGIEGLEPEREKIVDALTAFAGAASALIAIYSRVTATKQLTK